MLSKDQDNRLTASLQRLADSLLCTEEQEWLDTDGYPEEHHARQEIDKANRWFFIYTCAIRELAPLLGALHERLRRPIKVVEMGPGYGGLLIRLASWGQKHRIPLELSGFDCDPVFLNQAKEKTKHLPVTLFGANALDLAGIENGTYDLYVSTFTLHHFSAKGVITLLKEASRVAPHALYFRDFRRCLHGRPILSLALSACFFSRTTRHDGVLSLRRAYRPKEMSDLARAAGLSSHYAVKKLFPFYLSLSGISG